MIKHLFFFLFLVGYGYSSSFAAERQLVNKSARCCPVSKKSVLTAGCIGLVIPMSMVAVNALDPITGTVVLLSAATVPLIHKYAYKKKEEQYSVVPTFA